MLLLMHSVNGVSFDLIFPISASVLCIASLGYAHAKGGRTYALALIIYIALLILIVLSFRDILITEKDYFAARLNGKELYSRDITLLAVYSSLCISAVLFILNASLGASTVSFVLTGILLCASPYLNIRPSLMSGAFFFSTFLCLL